MLHLKLMTICPSNRMHAIVYNSFIIIIMDNTDVQCPLD